LAGRAGRQAQGRDAWTWDDGEYNAVTDLSAHNYDYRAAACDRNECWDSAT
jgi:hypothetical protein